MRTRPSVMHVDLDAFFAAVEQRDKPSLVGKPVVVGGLGPRGVVSTASYEARQYGVGSAMPMSQARRLCPTAAFLAVRFDVYRSVSQQVRQILDEFAHRVEPLSLDEAFLDLDTAREPTTTTRSDADVPLAADDAARIGSDLRAAIQARTGLTASVGAGTSKLVAKIASELAKPDGLRVVAAGEEQQVLDPLSIRALPGVGPATEARLHRLGVHDVATLRRLGSAELIDLFGQAQGAALTRLATGNDDRPVHTEREAKSISVEDTFDYDIHDQQVLAELLHRLGSKVTERLRQAELTGRTVGIKVRFADFTTVSRSATLAGPTDDESLILGTARRLLGEVPLAHGVRLLGVAISGLQDWTQESLFPDPDGRAAPAAAVGSRPAAHPPASEQYRPGQDVVHVEHGRGWVWGSGLGRVTVRFETAETGPGPVRTVPDDEALRPLAPTERDSHGSGTRNSSQVTGQ